MITPKKKTSDIENNLKNWLSNAQRVVIAGVGNPLRRDDFVGVEVVGNLRDEVSQNVYLIQCETVPESFIQPIIDFKPSHILVIDAGLLNSLPGSLKLVDPKEIIATPAVSTHALPLQIFCEYLAKTTNAKLTLLIIQPKETSFGEGLTEELQKTVKYLTSLLPKFLP
ncbi:MAG: hydrogenase 3 maturation endopeptidase HyCI [Candidatus Bathyarchaeota archaeon]|nr:hydrogenase 3 maturation endopeptidase HyCI [Candidatus Bathyarchaeota archaeon]MDH5732311.1 hydrogenase 3 maturation endopeptidase HyCI [Candidatus Bathyarchaeota archaeon]